MPPFSSRPLPRSSSSSSRNPLSNLVPSIRRRPFLLFGVPFTFTILSAAYGLSYLTQTRYEYNATKVQSVSKEEELGMKKGRRRVDLREEYWKLSRAREDMHLDADAQGLPSGDESDGRGADGRIVRRGGAARAKDEWDEWEPKRVPRPAGVEEWGDPSASALSASSVEQGDRTRDYSRKKEKKTSSIPGLASLSAEGELESAREVTYDLSKASPPDAKGNRTVTTESGRKVIIGPDGKPCKACNSRLALREAMRSAGGSGSAANKTSPTAASAAGSMFGAMAGASSPSSLSSRSEPSLSCPPDVEELGRSSWDLIHSIAATYPDRPSQEEQSALLGLLKALPLLYPCRYCAQALQEDYTRRETTSPKPMPEDSDADALKVSEAVRSKTSAMRFACSIHNEVNQRLGKPMWNCDDLRKLKQRWEDGGNRCV